MTEPKTPIKIDSTSNGEFVPREPPRHVRRALDVAASRITTNARRADAIDRARAVYLEDPGTSFATSGSRPVGEYPTFPAARGLPG